MLMHNSLKILSILTIALFAIGLCTTPLVYAKNPKLESREYKLLLEPSLFNGSEPRSVVTNYWHQLKALIQSELKRDTKGVLTFSKTRTVKFYDTQGTCQIKAQDYIFRERTENGKREVVLKYRSPDRYIAGLQNMMGSQSQAETKFEEDIGVPFITKYSHSTKQPLGSDTELKTLGDIVRLYPGLKESHFDLDESINLVSGLMITEKLYKGAKVDLGKKNGKFTLTLWYISPDSTSPVIAEISFKYGDADENYSKKVVTRAKRLFEMMQGMSDWVAKTSSTKTAFVFGYSQPLFCDSY